MPYIGRNEFVVFLKACFSKRLRLFCSMLLLYTATMVWTSMMLCFRGCLFNGTWNGGTVEWWNGGMVEWWNGGIVEWWVDASLLMSWRQKVLS